MPSRKEERQKKNVAEAAQKKAAKASKKDALPAIGGKKAENAKGFAKLRSGLKDAVMGDNLEHFRRMSVSVHMAGKKGRFEHTGYGVIAPALTDKQMAQMTADGNGAFYRFDPKKNQCCWDLLNGRPCRYKTKAAAVRLEIKELKKELKFAEEDMDAIAQLERDERVGAIEEKLEAKVMESKIKCPYGHNLNSVGHKHVDFISKKDVQREKELLRIQQEEQKRLAEEEKKRREAAGELTEEEKSLMLEAENPGGDEVDWG
jgi:hypothetical protein